MLLLAVESSCDETAAAVLQNGRAVSSVVSTQETLHAAWGGVVPELASRNHALTMVPVIRQALEQARVSIQDLEAVVATYGPGLIGSLLVGLQTAKGIAYARRLPFLGVNHLEGHLAAIHLEEVVPPPFVGLVCSGGHTALYHVRQTGNVTLLGETRDDAAGEAFDKAAKLVGLGYPGGAVVDHLAEQGDPKHFRLPRALAMPDNLEFSFSGVKTAARLLVEKHGPMQGEALHHYCASVRAAVVEVLCRKALAACRITETPRLVIAGGVAANTLLRRTLQASAADAQVTVHIPSRSLCTDNAAMIGRAGWERLVRGERHPLSLDADPQARLGQ
jgi:N6-L-threonylcarbamoyladenine synthase